MLVCVWLVSSLIHMISGCFLPALTEVTGYTRDSVVLPCCCTEGQPTLNSARWIFSSRGSDITLWSYPNTVNDRYKDRVNISATPGNLSLRLSDLTLSDEGFYRCKASTAIDRDIRLTVKGCVLSDSEPIDITGFTGNSVILPCACTNVQTKPERVTWSTHKGSQTIVIIPQLPANGGRYQDRVQVLDSISPGYDRYKDRVIISATPGNLSLHLSDLTLSDGGTYRCEADGNYRDISLTVIHRFDELCLKV
ncbi:uncharacterized protein LOC118233921 [Anguilla anguilla]|uniref:uncharacterized protein LOC118233921 n=1 Tax=Anguilla anguilla TaxID=7936 RepID=UPI0015ABE02A|nr:uncharacterized protein LOC118233921 [Anguilla anguilla]